MDEEIDALWAANRIDAVKHEILISKIHWDEEVERRRPERVFVAGAGDESSTPERDTI